MRLWICVIDGCCANNSRRETRSQTYLPLQHLPSRLQLPSTIMDLRMDVRRESYNHLGRMKIAFKKLPTPYVNNSDLSTFGVQLSQMSLHPERTIDFGPHFCT